MKKDSRDIMDCSDEQTHETDQNPEKTYELDTGNTMWFWSQERHRLSESVISQIRDPFGQMDLSAENDDHE